MLQWRKELDLEARRLRSAAAGVDGSDERLDPRRSEPTESTGRDVQQRDARRRVRVVHRQRGVEVVDAAVVAEAVDLPAHAGPREVAVGPPDDDASESQHGVQGVGGSRPVPTAEAMKPAASASGADQAPARASSTARRTSPEPRRGPASTSAARSAALTEP